MDEREKTTGEMTDQERERRLRRQRRLRQEMRRRRRRKALILRGVLAVIVLLLLALVIWGIVSAVRAVTASGDEEKDNKAETEESAGDLAQEELEEVAAEKVLHLSFQSLIADTSAAFSQEDTSAALAMDQGHLTVGEFEQVLQQLYDQGYVLVKLHDLASWDQETGTMTASTLRLPKGKKPLIISQMNVNYDLSLTGQGCASRIVLDENGELAAELTAADGTVQTGAYDVIPCVEEFIREHSDFSHNGARGILAFSGYNGVLGYRTDESLGSTENNRYASRYGVFDTARETADAAPVIQALASAGWEFASCGYDTVSYAEDLETVQADMELWQQRVKPLLGEVDILLFPEGTDIGTRKQYTEENEKYVYLREQGFHYFCAQDLGEAFTQVTDQYVRSNYWNLDGYRMYQDLYRGSGRFSGILNFDGVYDLERPSVALAGQTDTAAEEAAGESESA